MTVYVDELFTTRGAPQPGAEGVFGFGRQSCHLTADTPDELHAFARKVGLRRIWTQHEGRPTVHYDLTPGRRLAAVRLGAVETTARDEVRRLREAAKPS